MTGLVSATIEKPKYEIPPRRSTIFELTVEGSQLMCELQTALEATEGEITPEIEALLAQHLSHEGAVADKLESVGYVVKELLAKAERDEAEAAPFARQAEALRLRAKRKTTAAESIKTRVLALMKAENQTKIETVSHTFSIRKTPSKVELLVDESKLPMAYQRVKMEPDKIKLKDAIEAGNSRVKKYARMSEPGEKLGVT